VAPPPLVGRAHEVVELGRVKSLPPSWTLPSHQERRLVLAAVGQLLATLAGSAGTLLLLDDLQWAGQDALNLLAAVVRAAAWNGAAAGNAVIGPGSRQDFRLTSLGWTASRNVYVIYVGQDIRALEQQLGAANAHVVQLEAQIASQPAPVPVQTPPDPKAVEALNAMMELAKALKLVAA
jgi:hypothetical protein